MNFAGYEVKGLENIPDKGAALIVYYHGAIPIDIYYLNANLYIEKSRTLFSVMDNIMLKIPGNCLTCLTQLVQPKISS